jgi:hypothetical protein
MHDHGSRLSDDACSPAAEACPYTSVDLPCGCRDVFFDCGYIDREHDHVICDGKPEEHWKNPYPGSRGQDFCGYCGFDWPHP